MNKLFVILLSILTFNSMAKDGSSGCGLGWEVSDRKSLLSSAIRSTTNAILLNTLGMTFGTSGCEKHGIVKNDKAQLHFTEANLESLALDMAKGSGDYLDGLAFLMGCSSKAVDFAKMTQSHFSMIMSTNNAAHVIQNIKDGIRSDRKLSLACGSQS